MENTSAEIIILSSRFPVETSSFNPPRMPPLLALRKQMGLTFEEAIGVLHVAPETLVREEALDEPVLFRQLRGVSMRYFFYLNIHGNKRERNNIGNCLTLIAVRRNLFYFSYAQMGRFYGYTARQWYRFEIHDDILPRAVLEQITRDVHALQIERQ